MKNSAASTDRPPSLVRAVLAGLLVSLLFNGVWYLPGLAGFLSVHAMTLAPDRDWYSAIMFAAKFAIYCVLAVPSALLLFGRPFSHVVLCVAIATISLLLWVSVLQGGSISNQRAVVSVAFEAASIAGALAVSLVAALFIRRRVGT